MSVTPLGPDTFAFEQPQDRTVPPWSRPPLWLASWSVLYVLAGICARGACTPERATARGPRRGAARVGGRLLS